MRSPADAQSWVTSANDPASDFPLQNLPYGVFGHKESNRIGIAIGDQILDLYACAENNLLSSLPEQIVSACHADLLNPLMSLGPAAWSALRRQVTTFLEATQPNTRNIEPHLIPMHEASMLLPARMETTPTSTPPSTTPPASDFSSALTILCCPTTNTFPSDIMVALHRSSSAEKTSIAHPDRPNLPAHSRQPSALHAPWTTNWRSAFSSAPAIP